MVGSQPGKIVQETLSQKIHHKKGLVEWLKVETLSSSPLYRKKIKK
jgi:stalled ribosome alternative rescue factor ArfA